MFEKKLVSGIVLKHAQDYRKKKGTTKNSLGLPGNKKRRIHDLVPHCTSRQSTRLGRSSGGGTLEKNDQNKTGVGRGSITSEAPAGLAQAADPARLVPKIERGRVQEKVVVDTGAGVEGAKPIKMSTRRSQASWQGFGGAQWMKNEQVEGLKSSNGIRFEVDVVHFF